MSSLTFVSQCLLIEISAYYFPVRRAPQEWKQKPVRFSWLVFKTSPNIPRITHGFIWYKAQMKDYTGKKHYTWPKKGRQLNGLQSLEATGMSSESLHCSVLNITSRFFERSPAFLCFHVISWIKTAATFASKWGNIVRRHKSNLTII